jgi:hypothetical protein
MSAVVGLLPGENFGVAVLSNAPGTLLPNALMYRILDLHLKLQAKDYSAEMRARAVADAAAVRQAAATRVAGTRPTLSLDKYAGAFADSLYGQVQVRLDGDTLRLALGTRGEVALTHWHYDTFQASWPTKGMRPNLVTFTIDARANVTGMVIDAEGDITFRRLPAAARTAARSDGAK